MSVGSNIFIICILVHLRYFCLCDQEISYEGFSLLRIIPRTQSHLTYLLDLNTKNSSKFEFWLITTAINNSADLVVAPSEQLDLIKQLNAVQMPYTVLIGDIGAKIKDDEAASVAVPPGLEFFASYQDIEEINQYINDLATKYPDHVFNVQVGSSYEGRILQLLRISTNSGREKPAIWIQGGAHAREQIGPAVVVYMAEKLASLYHQCDQVSELVDTFDWYILPVLNPDGYDYCQKTDRLWRKTRSRHPNARNCIGVDANRNWDAAWNVAVGSSSDPCASNYAGPEAFSEPETKSTSEFMLQELNGRLHMFIDFHSYSQRWLTPWRYTSELPPNYQQQKRIAEVAAFALEKVNGTKYTVGSTGNIMYTVTGGARDWTHDVIGAKYSYVVELRDKGEHGFVLPKRLILPSAAETWAGVKAMALELVKTLHLES